MINAKSLTKDFNGFLALDKMSCSIGNGSVYGLVGSNGSGKSTLLRLISGIYKPDAGTIEVDGITPFENTDVKSRIFYVSDNPYFIHQSNVLEMAKFYSMFYNRFDNERFKHLSSIFPIDPKMRISNMSKGMQRQAALMLAMSSNPDYLLLDEAFDGLDPVIRQVLKKLLVDSISEYGLTAVISSHNLRELEGLSDHVGLLHKGKLVFEKELDELRQGIHKIQASFNQIPTPDMLSGLEMLQISQQGATLHMVVRGKRNEAEAYLKALNPIYMEFLTPTLEEIFIYELEVSNYDIKSILN